MTISERNANVIFLHEIGGMAEWSKAAVLKTVEGNTSVGSNPTPSAKFVNCDWLYVNSVIDIFRTNK